MYVSETVDETPHLDELTPREIVRELDKYVIGQAGAKRAVAIALRNRIRRMLPIEAVVQDLDRNSISGEDVNRQALTLLDEAGNRLS